MRQEGIRQVVLGADDSVRLEGAAPPGPPGPSEVLLAPVRLGICGSDVHVLDRRHPFIAPPVVTGHECVARVLETGADVTGLESGGCAPGDLVVVNPLDTCGSCRRCLGGLANQCGSAKVLGFGLPGTARDRFLLDQRYCHRVPDGVPASTAVLTEPLAVGWHAAARGPAEPGHVLIVGAGPVGLAVLHAVRARGGAAHVTVAEPVPGKRELAAELGADTVLETAEEALPDGGGAAWADTVFDCVAAPATLDAAAAATVPGGTVVVVGVPSGDRTLPLARLQRWEIDLRGTGLYVGADLDAVLARLAVDASGCAGLVTASYPVERAAEAFAATRDSRQVKVVVDWTDTGP